MKKDNDNTVAECGAQDVSPSVRESVRMSTATMKGLHQYYRDCLSQSFQFPDIGGFPRDLIQWAVNGGNADTLQLFEYLQQVPPGQQLSREHDRALRLMLVAIVQANLVTDVNNRFIDYAPSASFIDDVRRGIARILSLHDCDAYFSNAVQLLYRIGSTDDVLALAGAHPEIFAKYKNLQAMLGFVHTVLGNHAQALQYLAPLAQDAEGRSLPLVALSFMTCQYFLGQPVSWPLTFESLSSGLDDLPGLLAQLPPMEVVQPLPATTACPVVFVACNDAYFFQHALPLAYSLHETNPGRLALHLHLYSPNKSMLAEIEALKSRLPHLAIGFSVESGEVAGIHPKVYYATARFVRAYELMRHYQKGMCIVDADALFNRDWDAIQAHLSPNTEVVLACPSVAPFWERVLAGFVYCTATPKAEHFLAKTAQFILQNMAQKKTIWFADQIALSVNDAQLAQDDPAVKHVDSSLLIDMRHTPAALVWGVTTIKNGSERYDAARARLCEKYGQLSPASLDHVLKHISQQSNEPVFFLQVGAMDGVSFDPIHPYVKAFGWRGILVEPLPDMMQKVQTNYAGHPGLVFENVAITSQVETRSLYRIPAEAAKRAGLPDWVLGMSTFVPGKLDQFKPHVIEQSVACMPLAAVLEKHRPAKIDVLQIDTEGYDLKVLQQFDFVRYRPLVVNFEVVNLSSQERAEAMELLLAHGYVFYQNDMDIFAVRRDVLFGAL